MLSDRDVMFPNRPAKTSLKSSRGLGGTACETNPWWTLGNLNRASMKKIVSTLGKGLGISVVR